MGTLLANQPARQTLVPRNQLIANVILHRDIALEELNNLHWPGLATR